MTKERRLTIRFVAVFLIAYMGYTIPYKLLIPFMTEAG